MLTLCIAQIKQLIFSRVVYHPKTGTGYKI
jgi:hypothetical protein